MDRRVITERGTILIAVILVGWALHAMASVVVPVLLSILLAAIVAPVERGVRQAMPGAFAWLGLVAAACVVLAALGVFGLSMWFAADRIANAFDGDAAGVRDLLERARDGDGQVFGQSVRDILGTVGERAIGVVSSVSRSLAESLAGAAIGIVLSLFLMILILSDARRWRGALDAVGGEMQAAHVAALVAAIAHKLRVFFLTRAALGVLQAVLYISWLAVFGLDLLAVWGILTFLLTFVPNIGSIVSGSLPALYALTTRDLGTAAGIAAGIFAIEQIVGNYIDPKVQGRQLALSPTVILVAVVGWGWILGLAGAILAVPITIAIVVVMANVKELRPAALLLSDRTDFAALDEVTRVSP